jgi:integrase
VASIRKRSWTSGGENRTAWVVDYFDQNRMRHIKTFERKKEAEAFLTDAKHEVAQGTHTPASTSIDVAEACDLWLAKCEKEGLEPMTLMQYRSHVAGHIRPLLGRVRLSALTTPLLEQFKDDLIGRASALGARGKTRISRSTSRKVLTSLKSVLREMQRRGLIAKNPGAVVSIKAAQRDAGKKIHAGEHFPSKEEVNKLLAGAGRLRPLLLVAVFTGLRSSELRGLRWSDLDLGKGFLHVRQRADAKGVEGAPKSKAGTRRIPLIPPVVTALKEWKLACPRDGAELRLVFPNAKGKPQDHANLATRGFGRLQRDLKMVDTKGRARYGMHALRHFYASWIIAEGFNLKRVQELLGHSSAMVTLDVYSHLFPSDDGDHARLAAGALKLLEA